jgi:hypothetical protein
MGRSEISPFTEICFPEDYCSRITQLLHNEGIARGVRVEQGKRTGGRHHAICGVDVVLD